jgi:hypothetical protein
MILVVKIRRRSRWRSSNPGFTEGTFAWPTIKARVYSVSPKVSPTAKATRRKTWSASASAEQLTAKPQEETAVDELVRIAAEFAEHGIASVGGLLGDLGTLLGDDLQRWLHGELFEFRICVRGHTIAEGGGAVDPPRGDGEAGPAGPDTP